MCDIDFAQNGISIIGEPERMINPRSSTYILATYKMPPIGSRIILSIALGPRHVFITSATVFQDVINAVDLAKDRDNLLLRR